VIFNRGKEKCIKVVIEVNEGAEISIIDTDGNVNDTRNMAAGDEVSFDVRADQILYVSQPGKDGE